MVLAKLCVYSIAMCLIKYTILKLKSFDHIMFLSFVRVWTFFKKIRKIIGRKTQQNYALN